MSSTTNTRGTSRQIKNLFVNGRRTSLRLEIAFWSGFETCAREQGKSVHQLANVALGQYSNVTSSLSSAVRLLIIDHFREQALQAERAHLSRQVGGSDAEFEEQVDAASVHGRAFLAAVQRLGRSAFQQEELSELFDEIRLAVQGRPRRS